MQFMRHGFSEPVPAAITLAIILIAIVALFVTVGAYDQPAAYAGSPLFRQSAGPLNLYATAAV